MHEAYSPLPLGEWGDGFRQSAAGLQIRMEEWLNRTFKLNKADYETVVNYLGNKWDKRKLGLSPVWLRSKISTLSALGHGVGVAPIRFGQGKIDDSLD